MNIVSNYIQLKKENKFLKEQNKILTDDNYKFKEEIGRLKESNKSNPKENIKTISDLILNKKLEESSAECIKLITDNNIKDRDVFQESEKEYKEKINTLQQEIYKLESKIKEYEVYYDGRLKKECEKEIKKLKKIITNTNLENDNLRKDIESREKELYTLQAKLNEKDISINILKKLKDSGKLYIANLLLSSLNISIGFNSDKDIILISEEKMKIKENEFKKALEQLILGDDRNGEEN